MELNEGQKKALDIAIQRYNSGEKYTTIIGPAGSGKSTIVRFIIDALNPKSLVFATFTGKAAKVLQSKGNRNVTTLHKLLYYCKMKKDGTYVFRQRDHLDYSFIVVDECSMISNEMLDFLLSFPVHVIFLGDSAQLPPVKGEYNWLFKEPHAILTDIMRQAGDSDILDISTDIRLGHQLPNHYKGRDVQIFPKSELTIGMMKWADIIICATNATRRDINNTMRAEYGFSGEPQVGEKIICCHNDWNVFDDDGNPLVNGTIGYITRIEPKWFPVFKYIGAPHNKIEYYAMDFQTEEGTNFTNIAVDKGYFINGQPLYSPSVYFRLAKNGKLAEDYPVKLEEFDYAHAVSCWKSQGSEWSKVLLIEEGHPYDEIEHNKYLYTGATRAQDKLVIIRR